MYKIVGTRTKISNYENYMNSLPKAKYNRILKFLKETPTEHPDFKMKFKKIKNCCQYDLNEEARLIYSVLKKEKKVIIGYIGNHAGAKLYLQNNC